ncbi:MAG: hypothetical protein ACRCUE_01965 [Bosea sp. (in: a-proteobacteria)]
MFSNMADWLGFAVGVVSLILQLKNGQSRRRRQRSTRYRRWKVWGIEWTAIDHDDRSQS